MLFDDRLRHVLDRALAGARANLEHEVRALAQELAVEVTDERARVAAIEIDQLRRSFDTAVAELAADTSELDRAQTLVAILYADTARALGLPPRPQSGWVAAQ